EIDSELNQISKKYHMTVKLDNRIETDYNSDPQIESSIQNNYQYFENFSKSESELSDLHSDDSDYTQKRKKRKK
ncbi:14424_t:CDS:1, partial [Dentiscutata erythropus]